MYNNYMSSQENGGKYVAAEKEEGHYLVISAIKWFIEFCNMLPTSITTETQTSPLLPLTIKS